MALQNPLNSPVFANVASITSGNVLVGNGTDPVTSVAQVPVSNGGSGAASLTDHGVLVGSGTDPFTALTVGANGEILLGSTGADPVFGVLGTAVGCGLTKTTGAGSLSLAVNLTAGSGITLTPSGADTSIEISASSVPDLSLVAVTSGSSATAVAGNRYSVQTGAAYAYTLPATGILNAQFAFLNTTASSLFSVAPAAGGSVLIGATSSATGFDSTELGDGLTLVCVVAGAAPVYQAVAFNGNYNVI